MVVRVRKSLLTCLDKSVDGRFDDFAFERFFVGQFCEAALDDLHRRNDEKRGIHRVFGEECRNEPDREGDGDCERPRGKVARQKRGRILGLEAFLEDGLPEEELAHSHQNHDA